MNVFFSKKWSGLALIWFNFGKKTTMNLCLYDKCYQIYTIYKKKFVHGGFSDLGEKHQKMWRMRERKKGRIFGVFAL